MSQDERARRLYDLIDAVHEARRMAGASHAWVQHRAQERGKNSGLATERAFAQFNELLRQDGIRAALAYLCGLSKYRFVAIFRFSGGRATSVVHYDKLDPGLEQTAEVVDSATYCRFVRDRNFPFVVVDAGIDARTADHPARGKVLAYFGVPIFTAKGELLGTLCHYDIESRDASELDLELLLQVASTLARSGLIPSYPMRMSG